MAKATKRSEGAVASPTQDIVRRAIKEAEAVDEDGRRLSVRVLGPRHRMQLAGVVGAELSSNEKYFGIAGLAAAVTSIDGDPVSFPSSRRELEALVDRLGDVGLAAAGTALVKLIGIDVGPDGIMHNGVPINEALAAKN